MTAQKINLASHRKAKQFRTNLKEALAEGKVNFAGNLSSRNGDAAADARRLRSLTRKRAKYFSLTFYGKSLPGSISLGEREMLEYKEDSRLLIIAGYGGMNGGDSDRFQHGIFYLEWTGTNFKLLKFIKKPISK